MHWIITADRINKSLGEKTHVNRMRCGSVFSAAMRAAPPEGKLRLREEFKTTMTDEFRLFDDDGVLYYEGLCKDLAKQGEVSAFGPLDWAYLDSGCTRMDHRKIGTVGWAKL